MQFVQCIHVTAVFYCSFFIFFGICVDLEALTKDLTGGIKHLTAEIEQQSRRDRIYFSLERKENFNVLMQQLIHFHCDVKQ